MCANVGIIFDTAKLFIEKQILQGEGGLYGKGG